jgi:PAS domain S-box-containing protein
MNGSTVTDQAISLKLRLLIVEDSRSDVDLVLHALVRGGFEVVHEVVDSAASLRLSLEGHSWDVIISDHAMPHFSGPAALALSRELRPLVPFIIVSGEIDLNLAVSLMKDGALDYVQKSELARLVPVINRVLNNVNIQHQRQLAERALQISESRYRRLFETAQDGILIVDAETGQIDDVNPFLMDLVGYSREEYLGKKLWEVGAFKDGAASRAAFLELRGKGYIRFEDIPLHTRTGGCVDVEFVSNVYMVDDKKVIQCNIRDITERRRAEVEIRELNADLEHRVQARTVQVEALNKELETFNYSVSHDLRAPLRRIAGFVTALDEEFVGKLDSEGMELIGNIQASTRHMTELIEALLKLASFSTSKLEWRVTNLSVIANIVADELRQSNPTRDVNFVIAEGIMATGDAALLRIIMENLLQNAWKFTSHRNSARIEFGITSRSDKVPTFFVRDDGVGFNMKYAGKLFGAFQRLHAENEFPGTGIGLASVQRIIHRHGGNIRAESVVGEGTTFYFALEALPKDRGLSAASNREALAAGQASLT